MTEKLPKIRDRIRYFPNIWDENDYHDGTLIDESGTVVFDDGYIIESRTDLDAIFLLTEDKLQELGINYDKKSNLFTSRNAQMSPNEIALAVAENRLQLAYEIASGELVWLQKDDGDVEFQTDEKMKGYKFIEDNDIPLPIKSKMFQMLAQVAQYVANHGLPTLTILIISFESYIELVLGNPFNIFN